MTDESKQGLKFNVKAAFTQFPYFIATYVTLAGFAWLILSKWF